MARTTLFVLIMMSALLSVACGGEGASEEGHVANAPEPAEVETPAEEMTVSITGPQDGAEVAAGPVLVTLSVEGLTVVPAGDQTPRSGHHHLVVNADLPPMGAPIPSVEGQYIHMGAGQTELELPDMAPGEYTIIAVVGDFAHVPLDPLVVDTIHFVVRE